MIDENHEELAALYAFDLLEGGERERFESALASDPDLRRLVAQLRTTAAGLAHSAPEATPPPELRARVLASAERSMPATPAAPAGTLLRFPALVPWLAAAGLGITALWAGRGYLDAVSENRTLREQQQAQQASLEQVRSQLEESRRKLADSGREVAESGRKIAELESKLKTEGDLAHFKIATLASMLGNSPEALAVAVWDPAREEGILTVSKLPALAKDKDYQLWVVDTQYPAPVSGGVFVVDPVTGEARVKFHGDKPIRSIAKFAVSLERKGGVPLREGPIVLLSP